LKRDTKNSIVELERSFFNIQIIICVGEGFHLNYLFEIYIYIYIYINVEYIILVPPNIMVKICHWL